MKEWFEMTKAEDRKVLVLGVDGMDPPTVEEVLGKGRHAQPAEAD